MSGPPSRLRRYPIALVLAVLALLAQMGIGPVALRDAVAFAPSDPAICHSSGDPAAPAHQTMDCTLCVLCHALGAAAILPTPSPGHRVLRGVASRIALPEPAGRPADIPILASIYPTGPPILD